MWADQATCEDQSAETSNGSGAASTQRRENDEEDVDCGYVFGHIHHSTKTNSNEKYMLARAEEHWRSRKLDKLLINHDYRWSSFRSRPHADDKVPRGN